MPTAEFTISGDAYANLGYDATNGETLTLRIADTTGVGIRSVAFTELSRSPGAPALSISSGGVPSPPTDGVTTTIAATGVLAYLIQCQVNDGLGSDGKVDAALTKSRIVVVRADDGTRKMTAGERTEYDGTDGWVEAFDGLVDATIGRVKERKLNITTALLTASATSQVLNVGAALPAKAHLIATQCDLDTPFSGGGAASVTLDVGSSGDPDAVVDGASLFAAAVDGQVSDLAFQLGIALFKRFAASTQLTCTVASDVNVDTLTAGDATLRVLFAELP
jgi:hypothetical protein